MEHNCLCIWTLFCFSSYLKKVGRAITTTYTKTREGGLIIFIKTLRLFAAIATLQLLSGCSAIIGSATQRLADDLGSAILNSNDPAMVRDGAPAFLILIDSMLNSNPNNPALLAQSAELLSSYAGAFVTEPERAKKMHNRAKRQILDSVCMTLDNGCNLTTVPYKEFELWVESQSNVPVLYNLGSVWAGWIQASSDDFGAVAELARVKSIMERVRDLDDSHANGGVYLYLGVFDTLVPPGLGGKPEQGKAHFERALEISDGRNLMVKVMYAEQYARLIFDRDLHDSLLKEVLSSPADSVGLTLMNTVAQERARGLMDTADEYF